jgi:hypothetical protein
MQLPLKECTGRFTQTMGLPCAHVCNDRKALGGLQVEDFDEHWFWDRTKVRIPLREPLQVRGPVNQPEAITGRILSTFEVVQPTRLLPKCSACHQRGHIRTSRNCPIRLRAEIALSSQQLQENGYFQASQGNNISIATSISVTIPSTASIVAPTIHLPSISGLTGFPVPVTARNPVVTASSNVQHTFQVQPATPDSPEHTFQVPTHLENIPASSVRDSQSPISSSISIRLSISVTPPLVLIPLAQSRPEMIFIKYKAEKDDWLANHPYVPPNQYRKKRGFRVRNRKILDNSRYRLPLDRRKPSGELIAYSANWTYEEIDAWVDNEQREEDELADQMMEDMKAGRAIKDKNVWYQDQMAQNEGFQI